MPRCRERPLTAICICWLTDLGDEVSIDWFGCVTFYVNSTKGYNIRDLFLCSLFCLGFFGKQRQVHHCFSQTKQAILCTFHSISSSVMAFTYLHADGGVWLLRYELSHLFKSSFSSFICGRSDGLMVSALDSGSKAPWKTWSGQYLWVVFLGKAI